MSTLPLVTRDLPGIGGRIKDVPGHFVVEEIALYEPCGAGEHVYVRHRRANRTTRDIVGDLARAFRIDPRGIGYAGLKDKHAVATQTFSLQLFHAEPDEVAQVVSSDVGGEVLDVRRHTNKLRRGHLLGNRFAITVVDAQGGALERARAIAAELEARGLPNFFGPQRFGRDGENVEAGRRLLANPRGGWLSALRLSAWQSDLFNTWLVQRLERGRFERVLAGDVAKRLDNGALFDVVDETAENARVLKREITYTGPIFGASMRAASGEPGEIERAAFEASGATIADLARAKLEGTRRAARIFLEDFAVEPVGAGLSLSFRLPKGAYATTALREFMKADAEMLPDAEDAGEE
jgi:tRNA pseudouridine13 synthase